MKCLVFTASVLASLIVFADKVNLISGSSLSGKAGVVQGDKIVFVSDDLGEIKIPVEKIASLESDNEHVIEYKDGTKTEKKVTVEEGAFVVSLLCLPPLFLFIYLLAIARGMWDLSSLTREMNPGPLP